MLEFFRLPLSPMLAVEGVWTFLDLSIKFLLVFSIFPVKFAIAVILVHLACSKGNNYYYVNASEGSILIEANSDPAFMFRLGRLYSSFVLGLRRMAYDWMFS